MLWRSAGMPAPGEDWDLSRFSDGDEVSAFALMAVRWAVSINLLRGYDDGKLYPKGTATRAEIAAMVARWGENMD